MFDEQASERAERLWGLLLGAVIAMAVGSGVAEAAERLSPPHQLPGWLLGPFAVALPVGMVAFAFLAGVRYAQRMNRLGRRTRFGP